MKKIIFVYFLALVKIIDAQNLAPNYSFENYSSCPNSPTQIAKAVPWFQPNLWVSSSDLFNACSSNGSVPLTGIGFCYARTGVGFAGIITYSPNTDYREYLEVELTDSLQINQPYCVSFYVARAGYTKYAADGLEAYLSNDSAIYYSPNFGVFPATPQIQNPAGNIITDTANWTLIQDNFIAHGGEKFITIGNFKNLTQTNGIMVQSSGIVFAYYFIDDVSVVPGPCIVGVQEQHKTEEIKIYPNPAKDICTLTAKGYLNAALSIYDAMGRKMMVEKFNEQATINMSTLADGIYFIRIEDVLGRAINQKIVKE